MSVYEYSAKLTAESSVSMETYKDKVLLIVNTASACGFTPQYGELQELYAKYGEKGFAVLAFPCNQFGSQESGSNAEIKKFCDLKFNISFPVFQKVDVNGKDTHPLFKYLKEELPGILGSKNVKWNFTKFLVDKKGNPVKRYAPKDKPSSFTKDIEALL